MIDRTESIMDYEREAAIEARMYDVGYEPQDGYSDPVLGWVIAPTRREAEADERYQNGIPY